MVGSLNDNFRSIVPALAVLMLLSGCIAESEREVIVFCALDKEFSEPVLQRFETETGIKVLAKYDQESNKTVGLANQIIQQREQQHCDVFWNNEILHTLRLKKMGLLAACPIALKSDYPKQFVSADSDWYGFAARARVFLVNTDLLPNRDDWPTTIRDLAKAKWKGNCGLAKPFFGTTASHAAVLYSSWGTAATNDFFRAVAGNAFIEGGNKQVAINVARGQYAFGLTDTDDAIIELEQGHPVAIVFPDQAAESSGTLLIPNTVCLVAGGPNLQNGRRLIEFLLQHETEEILAQGRSAQIPLRQNSTVKSRVQPANLKILPVDFEAAAAKWDEAKEQLLTIFSLSGS